MSNSGASPRLRQPSGGWCAARSTPSNSWPDGYAIPNRRIMYAALNWCQEHHTEIIDTLRTLMGGVPLQMPADSTILDDPALKEVFDRWWGTPAIEAADRMKLYKLGWDITGSEFAGRHQLYEKFYAGHSALVRASCDREAPWEEFHATVDRALAEASSESALGKRRAGTDRVD